MIIELTEDDIIFIRQVMNTFTVQGPVSELRTYINKIDSVLIKLTTPELEEKTNG